MPRRPFFTRRQYAALVALSVVVQLVLLLPALLLVPAPPDRLLAAPLIIAWLATFLAEWLATVIAYTFTTLVSALVSKALFGSSNKSQPANFQSQAEGRKQVVRSSVEARRLCYGRVRVSGPLVYAVTTTTTTVKNQNLNLIVPVAGHEIDAYEAVNLGERTIAAALVNPTTGVVAALPWNSYVHLHFHYGTTDQVADAEMRTVDPKWTANHRLRGVAYLHILLGWNENTFPTGIPNPSALIRGKKLYDPRTGLTAWSNNPALVMRDYVTSNYGLGAGAAEIDDASFIAAANVCDERVAMAAYSVTVTADATANTLTTAGPETRIANGDGVQIASTGTLPSPLLALTTYYAYRPDSTTIQLATTAANALIGNVIDLTTAGTGTLTLSHIDQSRYTADGTVSLADKPTDIIGQIQTACAGALVYTQGVYKFYAGAYAAPVYTLTESDLRDTLQFRPRIPRRELFNAVRGTYVDPFKSWEGTDFPIVANAMYAQQDGGQQIARDIELPFTTNPVRAQRIAKIHLEKSRQGLTVDFPAKLTALRLSVWDTVQVTIAELGWTNKVFRVASWQMTPDGSSGVDLVLQEESSASYNWNAGEATNYDTAPNTDLPDVFNVGVPGTPVVTEELYETSGSSGVKSRANVSWTAAADAFVNRYQFEYKLTADTAYTVLPVTSGLTAVLDDLAPGTYDFRVKALNNFDVSSAYTPVVTQAILGLTAPPSDVTGFSIIKSAGFGLAQWTPHPDLDVQINGAIVIRHSMLTSGAIWNDSVIVDEAVGGAQQLTVPLIQGTYLAKARDSSGNYSNNAVSFVATEGLVTGFTLAFSTDQAALGFTGAKTNVAKVGAGIQLDSTTLIDSMVTSIDSWPFIDALGGVSATGSYAFDTYLDMTTVATRRLESDIQVTQFDTGDLIDARLNLIDDWGDFEGSVINDCDVTLYVRTTDDNPAGSPTWGGWMPYRVADVTCRALQHKLDFISGNAQHNISCTTLKVDVKIPV